MKDLWQKLVFPVKRLLFVVAACLKPPTSNGSGAGLLKLRDDIQSFGYEDVQVMWEMLRTESDLMRRCPKRKQRSFWRILIWQNHPATPSSANNISKLISQLSCLTMVWVKNHLKSMFVSKDKKKKKICEK